MARIKLSQILFITILEELARTTNKARNKKHSDWKRRSKIIFVSNIMSAHIYMGSTKMLLEWIMIFNKVSG